MIWLLQYTGKSRWNYSDSKVVRAPNETEARNFASAPAEEWTCEHILEDGETDIIMYSWVGDPG